MVAPQLVKAKKKPKVEVTLRFNPRRSLIPKKHSFAAPMQGLEHIIFDYTGTAKAVSTFNLNIEAISKHVPNHLKYNIPLATLAICELKEPTITFLDDPKDLSNLVKKSKRQRKYIYAHNQQKW
jgi:hypothetical protein